MVLQGSESFFDNSINIYINFLVKRKSNSLQCVTKRCPQFSTKIFCLPYDRVGIVLSDFGNYLEKFSYIAFGGLVDDTKKGEVEQQSEGRKSNKMASLIPLIIILTVIAIAVLSGMGYITLPKINIGSFENSSVKPLLPSQHLGLVAPLHPLKQGPLVVQ